MILERHSHHLIFRNQIYATDYMMYLHMIFLYASCRAIGKPCAGADCTSLSEPLMLIFPNYEFIDLIGSLKFTM